MIDESLDALIPHIESLIFTADSPLTVPEIKSVLDASFETTFSQTDILKAVETLKLRYAGEPYAFEIVEIADGYRFLTKGAFQKTVGTYLKQTTKKRLSPAALEVLSVVAYKQPVSKSEVEQIRGVNCDYAVQKLLEKELIIITGRSEAPGRPLLYGTADKFMDYFGLKSIKDLPQPKDFKEPESNIGVKTE
jgi:segregation and condensation protein B